MRTEKGRKKVREKEKVKVRRPLKGEVGLYIDEPGGFRVMPERRLTTLLLGWTC